MIKRMKKEAQIGDIAYATEMIKYSKKNSNLVAFGPGDPTQAHVIDEHIDVREVLEAARLYVALCEEMQKE
jgi:acetylornithine deacetylase/succinyl-diaminopimelate desuccinylase-like protein